MPRNTTHRIAAIGAAAALCSPSIARGDLTDDAERLAKRWAARGATVERREPIFVEHGRARAVAIDRPARPGEPPVADGCLTVAFVAVRTVELSVAPDEGLVAPDIVARMPGRSRLPFLPHAGGDDARRARSAGGAAMISRCGVDRAELRRVTVETTAARATVEIVVARSAFALGELGDVMPERAAGPIAPRGDPGGPIEPGPIADRLSRAEKRARGEGAAFVTRTPIRASDAGTGEFSLRVGDGCHRVEVMADVPATFPHRATDVDAEAHERDTGRVLARDRADIPDARLDFCVGEPTFVDVPFAGASGAVRVTLSDARWPLSQHLPARFGARARAGFASALMRRNAQAPREDPIAETLGVNGLTEVPIEVEPGRCYLAAMALIRGDARAMRLSARVGDRAPHDDVIDKPESASIAFCAEVETSVLLDVDARGNSAWWALAVWPMGSATP